jgi:hypothetical protein
MAITLETWEDTGAATGSPPRGTTRQSVDGLSWKDSPLDETVPYADYPVRRPEIGGSPAYYTSYSKYYYLKISGTYPLATRLTARFDGNVNGTRSGYKVTNGLRIYYKWTSTYAAPSTTLISSDYIDTATDLIWYPKFSTVGPQAATTRLNTLTGNTTYYTEYLVTQLYVAPGEWTDYGNIGDVKLKFVLHEYESTDI